jgi:hypothetical protein
MFLCTPTLDSIETRVNLHYNCLKLLVIKDWVVKVICRAIGARRAYSIIKVTDKKASSRIITICLKIDNKRTYKSFSQDILKILQRYIWSIHRVQRLLDQLARELVA